VDIRSEGICSQRRWSSWSVHPVPSHFIDVFT